MLLLAPCPLLSSSPLPWTCCFGLFVFGPLLCASGPYAQGLSLWIVSCLRVASVSQPLAVDMPFWTSCLHGSVVSQSASVFQPLPLDMPFWTFCLRTASVCFRAICEGLCVLEQHTDACSLQGTCRWTFCSVSCSCESHGLLLSSSPLPWTCRFGLFVFGPLLDASGWYAKDLLFWIVLCFRLTSVS